MPSEALKRFKLSMQPSYEQWHDGIPWDLEALKQLEAEELAEVEASLVRRVDDWRVIEALDAIGSPPALTAIERALGHERLEVRIPAAECLARRELIDAARIEAILIQALAEATITNGMVMTFRFVQQHPTPAVLRRLLTCARSGHPDVRVHAAALVQFLHGKARSDFDMSKRAFYLRFNAKDPAERERAYAELCESIGVPP